MTIRTLFHSVQLLDNLNVMDISVAIINKLRTPIILSDEKLLNKDFRVITFNYKYTCGFKIYIDHLRLIIWLLINIRSYEIIYTRFIDKQAFICTLIGKLFGKKSIVIPAGDGIANLPAINFGILRKRSNLIIARLVYKYSSAIIPVSKFAKKMMLDNLNVKDLPKVKIISNGINFQYFKSTEKKKLQFITVGGCNTIDRMKLKGIDTFIKLSNYFQEYNFIVIGMHPHLTEQLKQLPKNVFLIPWLNRNELKRYLSESKFICQLSVFETFGIAFAEGIACECIPIAYCDIGSSELIKDFGLKIPSHDFETTLEYFKKALYLSHKDGNKARKAIEKKYTYEHRRKELQNLINSLLN